MVCSAYRDLGGAPLRDLGGHSFYVRQLNAWCQNGVGCIWKSTCAGKGDLCVADVGTCVCIRALLRTVFVHVGKQGPEIYVFWFQTGFKLVSYLSWPVS